MAAEEVTEVFHLEQAAAAEAAKLLRLAFLVALAVTAAMDAA
jgi:hypothetical protein